MTVAAEARQAMIDIATISRRELFNLWQELTSLPPDMLRDALMDLLPGMGDEYGNAAASLAADWYDDLREAAGVPGVFVATPSDPPSAERWQSLVRWGVSPLYQETPDYRGALQLIDGGFQRTVSDRHRLTVVDSTKRDPQAKGWRRVGVGRSCGFCRMLIDRGAVYSGDGVTFRSHDGCNCGAAPSWDESAVTVSDEPYRQSQNRPRSDAARRRMNQRAYAYIREHYGEDAL